MVKNDTKKMFSNRKKISLFKWVVAELNPSTSTSNTRIHNKKRRENGSKKEDDKKLLFLVCITIPI